MRTLTSILCVVLLLSTASPDVNADEVDYKKLVSDFITPQMPDARRDEIIKELADAKPQDLAGQLRKAIAEDDKRTHALRLAIEFQVSGLWPTAEKQYETAERNQIITYGLTTLDKGSEKFLIERWKKCELESEEYRDLSRAFQTFGLDPRLLDEFVKAVQDDQDPKRAEIAQKVLYFQTGWKGWDKEEFLQAWPEFLKKLRETGSSQKIKGRDMIRRADWTKAGATNWGYALRLESGSSANNERCAPPGLSTGVYSVLARVWFETDQTSAKIAFNSNVGGGSYGGFVIEFEENEWKIEAVGKTLGGGQVPAAKWIEIRWDIVQPHPEPNKADYLVTITVNGTKAFGKPLNARGTPCRASFTVDTGALVVGAVDYIRD